MAMSGTMDKFMAVLADRHGFMKKMKNDRGRKTAGYLCDYVPEEILWAAGMDTVRLTGGTGNVVAADRHLQSNVCSFCRRVFEQGLAGIYEYLDALVIPHTCDVINKMYDLWAYRMSTPEFLHYLWVPHKVFDKDAPGVMLGEIKRLKKCLEEYVGRAISETELTDAIVLFDRSRELLKQIYALRQSDPPRISGIEAFAVALSSLLAPKDLHNVWMEELLAERASAPPDLAKRPRVLIAASMLDDLSLVGAVEDAGAWVVTEDICVSTRYFYDRVGTEERDPLKALTKRYLNKLPCPRSFGSFPPRREHILNMIRDYRVDGVIFYILRCCDAHLFQYPLLRERLAQENVPMLYIQGDQTVGINEAIQNRIKAFTEMLNR
jgi:benzoyl-CoA reductase subunit C